MRVTLCLAFHWLGCRMEETPPAKTDPTTSSPILTTPTSPTDTTIDLCPGEPPRALSFDVTGRATLVNTLDVAVTLDAEAAVAIACTRSDDPTEELLYTSPAATEHLIPMRGLAADTTYTCRFVATCPASVAPVLFEVTTDPLPEVIPPVAVSTPTGLDSTAPPFVLLGHDRHCPGDSARLLMYDARGEIRWYYEQVPDIDIAYESQYLGNGEFTWGGGFYDGEPPELFDVDHNTLYVTNSERTASGIFHHDGRLLPNGQMMTMMIEPNTNSNGFAWDGFSIDLVDPATGVDTFFYSSQEAVDDGDLQPGWGDPWHANWADYQEDPVNGDRLYVSLCSLGDIIAIDAATKDVLWTFGDTGDFQLVNTSGELVPRAFAWPQCQHGLEFVPFAGGGGGNLLVYDNGAYGRGFSRLLEYELDETTMVATLLWSWTEPVWMEPSWGDVDYLDNGNVLGTMGHACWSPNIDDVSSVVELDPIAEQVVWRMDFLSPGDAIYRSERVDACDVFPISGLCPAVDMALSALRPLLDPCGPGGTDVDQDGDGVLLCADADCDDLDPDVYPGNPELCDGVDNDCDGVRDNGFAVTDWYLDYDGDGIGDDSTVITGCAAPPGHVAVGGDCDDHDALAVPGGLEVCDGIDNDCNGFADESESCWDCAATGDYLVCSTAVPWADARDACLGLGHDLVTIDDGTENDTVGNLAPSSWIGLNDIAVEGAFEWADGTPVGYTSWWLGEPNNSYDEDCAGINYGDIGGWNDYPCGELLPFICER